MGESVEEKMITLTITLYIFFFKTKVALTLTEQATVLDASPSQPICPTFPFTHVLVSMAKEAPQVAEHSPRAQTDHLGQTCSLQDLESLVAPTQSPSPTVPPLINFKLGVFLLCCRQKPNA